MIRTYDYSDGSEDHNVDKVDGHDYAKVIISISDALPIVAI